MHTELLIKIENRKIALILKEKRKVLDESSFLEEHNLTERLLPEIDGLLRKNKLMPKDITKAKVETDLGESYTTNRIAKAVAGALNAGKNLII